VDCPGGGGERRRGGRVLILGENQESEGIDENGVQGVEEDIPEMVAERVVPPEEAIRPEAQVKNRVVVIVIKGGEKL
jgi:hypothetical protein